MIRIKTINIKEFRGIRDLELTLTSENFGIYGPNGTGKSGVIDAIEFCLTGDVTRLSGQGTIGLSVKSHAPHVDCRKKPEKAKVTITASIPSLGKDVTISRSVKNSKKVAITPADNDVETVVKVLQAHPEFALSRREIVKYIMTPPGRRSVDVQTLLRLDCIENLRKIFTTFANHCKRDADEAKRSMVQATNEYNTALGLVEPSPEQILRKVNEYRQILGLKDLTKLTPKISFQESEALPDGEHKKSAFVKAVALADLEKLTIETTSVEPDDLREHRQVAKNAVVKLQEDEKALSLARQHGFISTGLDLITEDNVCPLCDTPWDADALRMHLKAKLLSINEIEEVQNKLRTAVDAILYVLESRIATMKQAKMYCNNLKPPIPQGELDTYLESLSNVRAALNEFLKDYSKTENFINAVNMSWWAPSATVQARINECKDAVNALPDSSSIDDAHASLAVLQDRRKRVANCLIKVRMTDHKHLITNRILELYIKTSIDTLESIYTQVAEDFSKFYRIINHEDEDKFVGKLMPEPAKLNLNVDFYGRGISTRCLP